MNQISKIRDKSFFAGFIFLGFLTFTFSTGCSDNTEKGEESLPNIIFILADDLGYGDVETLNPESKIPTPNLNEMAGEGMLFTNAHAPAAVCTPTRYSILTGRYPWRSEMKQGVLWVWDDPLIGEEEFTLPKLLNKEGYHTALIGKWHLGWNWPTKDGKPVNLDNEGRNVDFEQKLKGGPLSVGFDYYFGDDVPSFPPHTFIENDRVAINPSEWKEERPGLPGPMAPGWTYEALLPKITEKAVNYIQERTSANNNKPFFLFFSMSAPHTPIAPADPFIGRSEAGRYGDFVYQVDHSVGEILKVLEEMNISNNTLILFSSDNGAIPVDGENYVGRFGSIYEYGHYPNGNLRGVKSDAWEGGHRVPLIARWNNRIEPGSVSDELISLADLMATFGALTSHDIPVNEGEDSYNMLPLLLGENTGPVRKSMVTQSGNGILSYHKGKWKLIMSSGSGGSWSKPEGELAVKVKNEEDLEWENVQLYNLETDLTEQVNVAKMYPEITSELIQELTYIIRNGRSTGGENLENDGSEVWRQVEWMRGRE